MEFRKIFVGPTKHRKTPRTMDTMGNHGKHRKTVRKRRENLTIAESTDIVNK